MVHLYSLYLVLSTSKWVPVNKPMSEHIAKALDMTIPDKRSNLIDAELQQGEVVQVVDTVQDDHEVGEVKRANKELERISRQASAAGIDLLDEASNTDPKFKGRLMEVAANLLSTSVSAIKQRQDASLKLIERNDKKNTPGAGGGVTNNNLIVSDRNELMALINSMKKEGKS